MLWPVSSLSDWSDVGWTPSANFFERDGKYIIQVEVPGADKDDVSVSVEDGFVTITGKKEMVKEEKEANYYVKESSYGEFSRAFRVPSEVDEDNVSAEFKNGVLTVELPKKEKKVDTKKKIEVK
jgi:HSP20 family protein